MLSVGWRSGSTLLQRLIVSSKEVLVWGEPFDRLNLVSRMAASLVPIDNAYPWHPQLLDASGASAEELASSWIAKLSPDPSHLRAAYRDFFRRLLGRPAEEQGFARWGLKEVRLGGDEARFLQWLFPAATFVILHRDPYRAYRSYADRPALAPWYRRWGEDPVISASDFGRHWADLAESLLDAAPDLGALVVGYDELVAGASAVDRIEEHLSVTVDRGVLGEKVGSYSNQTDPRFSRAEVRALRRTIGATAERLGYHPAS